MALWSALPRYLQPEIMDQPGLDAERHRHALDGLRRINAWSGSAGILWPSLAELARALAPRSPRVLDVACGGGDVAIQLWHRARRARLGMVLEGCDVSPLAVDHATQASRGDRANVRFFVADALQGDLSARYDAMICSLFLHHLTEDQAVDLLRRMAAATRLVLVNDLVRSHAGLLLARVATQLLTRSDVVRVDGPRSVEQAFTADEVWQLAARAGLSGATVEPRWPCRLLLTWWRA
jgi:SAM-dependent methyltransferase